MSKWSIQSPIRKNPSVAECLGSIVINFMIYTALTACGIKAYNNNKKEGKQNG